MRFGRFLCVGQRLSELIPWLGPLLRNLAVDRARRKRRAWLNQRQIPRFVHVLNQDKFIPPFVSFVNEHLDPFEHLFVVTVGDRSKFPIKEPSGNLVDLIGVSRDRLIPDLEELCKFGTVIIHCLADDRVAEFFGENEEFARRAFWLIWGQDMYRDFAGTCDVGKRIRTKFASRIAGLLVVATGDSELANKAYGVELRAQTVRYPLPVGLDVLSPRATGSNLEPVVQVNNSCDASTLAVLERLARLDSRQFRVRVIHSYGDLGHAPKIEAFGSRVFGSRFEAVSEYLSAASYGSLLSETDVLILNQPRQQGLGNVLGAVYSGCKVFVRSDTSSFRYLKDEWGLQIYDSIELPDSLGALAELSDDVREENSDKARRLMDLSILAQDWAEAFQWMEGLVDESTGLNSIPPDVTRNVAFNSDN